MKKKANLKMLRNLLFFIGLIYLTFWIIFNDQSIEEIKNVIKSANTNFILLAVLLMFCFFLTEAYNVKKLLNVFGDKISLISALKFTWIGFFFSAITPAASGGQPIEIYYMTKEKVSGANATMVLLIQLCSFQISSILIGIICAILNPAILNDGLIWLFLYGIIINGFILSVMLICIFSKKLTQKIVNLFIKILEFFKIKNIETKKKKIEEGLEKYNESSIFIKSHKGEFIKSILRVFMQVVFYYTVPYCVYKAFGLTSYNIFQMFTMQAILFATVSGLPLPGSVGVSETVFLKIFEPAFGNKILSGAMLLSRGITFYLYVIISLIIVVINAFKMKNIIGEIDQNVMEIEKLENIQ